MNRETFLNVSDIIIDEEHCASLTPSFCPEIIALLHSQRRHAKRNVLMSVESNYGFDEHAHGLC